MGVVSRWMWVESMGVACGCGCKEVYRFPLCFCSSIPTFCSLKKMFFVLVLVLFCNKILGIK